MKESEVQSVIISLNSIDKVKEFNSIITKYEEDFDLISGRYVINAKSIMGTFSLDLTKDLKLVMYSSNTKTFANVLDSIKKFLV